MTLDETPDGSGLPPLPPGFTLDQPQTAAPRAKGKKLPPLPDGFKLDSALPDGYSLDQPVKEDGGFLDSAANIAKGAGERVAQIVGGGVRTVGNIAETAGDYLERHVPLGRVTLGSTADNGVIGWEPNTEADIAADEVKGPADRLATKLAAVKFGYQPGTTWQDVKSSPVKNFIPFALETGLVSAPDMAAAMTMLPAYVGARAGELGQQRAQNNDMQNATVGDLLKALPAATVSAMLDRFGGEGMFGLGEVATKSLLQVPKEMVKAGVKEGGTEAAQQLVEDVGSNAGTKKGMPGFWQEAENMLAAGAAGLGFGAGVRGGGAAVETMTGGHEAAAEHPPLPEGYTLDNIEPAAERAGDAAAAAPESVAEGVSPPSSVASPAPQPAATSAENAQVAVEPAQRAMLRKMGWADEDIDTMAPEEVMAEADRGRQAGLTVSQGDVAAAQPATPAAPQPTEVAAENPQTPENPVVEPATPAADSRRAQAEAVAARAAQPQAEVAVDPVAQSMAQAQQLAAQRQQTHPTQIATPAQPEQVQAAMAAPPQPVEAAEPQIAPASPAAALPPQMPVEQPAPRTRKQKVDAARPAASWAIRDKATGEVVMETFDRKKVEALNTAKYEAVPIQQYLAEFNRAVKKAGGVQPAAGPAPVDVGKRRAPVQKGPLDIVQFLAHSGGVQDFKGELKAIDAHKAFVPGVGRLVRAKGMPLDKAREMAAEQGYFDHIYGDRETASNKSTVADLLNLIDETRRGKRAVSSADVSAAGAQQEAAGAEERDARAESAKAEVAEISGLPADHPMVERAAMLVMSDGMEPDAALERAAIEDDIAADAETEATPAADLPPFEAPHGNEVQPGSAPEGSARAGSEGRPGERSRAEGNPEASGSEPPRRGEGRKVAASQEPDEGGAGQGEPQREPSEEVGAEGLPQTVIPGAERITRKQQAEREASKPMRPKVPQKDAGELFDTQANSEKQDKLFDQSRTSRVAESAAPPRISPHVETEVRRIVKDVAGIEPQMLDAIMADAVPEWGITAPQYLGGYYDYVQDVIAIALHGGGTQTAYHEAFHRLQLLFLNPRERQILRAETERLRQIVATKRGAEQAAAMAPVEVEADAFSYFADQMDADNAGGFRLHIAIRRAWNRMRQVLRRVRNYLNGLGYQTAEDVFGKAKSGEIVKRGALREPLKAGEQMLYSIAERVPNVPEREGVDKQGMPSTKALAVSAGQRIVKILKKGTPTEKDNERVGAFWVRKFEDYLDPVKRMVQAAGGGVQELQDAYAIARLASTRAKVRINQLHDEYVNPIVEALAKSGAAYEDFERYLYAMHAEERNRVVGLRNPEDSDFYRAVTNPAIKGASGWSTNQARKVLRDLSADKAKLAGLQEAGTLFRRMMDRKLLDEKQAGLISTETHDLLTKQWKHYAPLKAEDGTDSEGNYLPGRGRGFDVRGDEFKGATGRSTEAENILAWAIAGAERTQIRSEKNDVFKALVRFLNEFDPKGESIAKVYWSDDSPALGDIEKAPAVYRRELGKDGKVKNVKVPPATIAPEMFAGKVGGKTYYVQFADPKVGMALKKLGITQLNAFFRLLRFFSVWQSVINTRVNPEFALVNIARDALTGVVHLEGMSASQSSGVLLNIPKAMAAMWRHSRGSKASGEWDAAAREYVENGGKINFDNQKSLEEHVAALQKAVKYRASGKITPRVAWNAFIKFVEDVFDAGENGIRLSAYKAARGQGMTARRAALMARELTVDFEKRGEISSYANAYSAFFNASYQGSANIVRRLATSKRVRKAALGILISGVLMDMFNRAMSGDDDDGENRYAKMLRNEKWKLERQMVIFYGSGDGSYFTIPLPYGYNAIYHAGLQMSAMGHQDVAPLEGLANIARVAFDAYNPLGSGGTWWNIILPTMLDPLEDIHANTNFFGAPIYNKPFPGDHSPQSYRGRQSTPEGFKKAAETVNAITGGNEVEPGSIDMAPEVYEYLWGFVTGGLGRLGGRIADTGSKIAEGKTDEIEPQNVPWVRSFYGQLGDDSKRSEYYQQREEVRLAKEYQKDYRDAGDKTAKDEFEARNKVAIDSILAFDNAEKQLRKIRKAKLHTTDEADLKSLEQREIKIMNDARLRYAKNKAKDRGK